MYLSIIKVGVRQISLLLILLTSEGGIQLLSLGGWGITSKRI